MTTTSTSPTCVAPRVRLLIDPADTVDCVCALAARHRPREGVVVCHPLPDVDNQTVLADDLLVALGKRPGALAAEGLLRRGWELAGLWLRAERTAHLVVLRAHLLPAVRWRDLIELVAAAGAVLWLVSHRVGLDPAHRAVLAEHGVAPAGQPWRDALAALTPTPDRASAEPDPRPFPTVPDVDFPTFRATARRVLDPEAFARVDAVYRATLTAARGEAHTLQVMARRTAADTQTAVEATIQRMTVNATSEAEVLTRLRAAQAGFFREGTLLRVHLYRHRSRGLPGFSLRPRLPAAVADRLHAICAPAPAGAMAIRVVTGFSIDVLVRLRVGDVIDRGQDIDIRASGGRWRIPAPIASLVRATLADNPADLAGRPDLPLFPHGDAPMMPARAMRRLFRSAARTRVGPADRRTGIETADLQTVDPHRWIRSGGPR